MTADDYTDDERRQALENLHQAWLRSDKLGLPVNAPINLAIRAVLATHGIRPWEMDQ